MRKEKQIEEMAEHMIEIQRSFNEYCAKPCRECETAGIVNCENHYKAEALYNAGYRKQREGEWVKNDHGDNICSCCRLPANYKSRYCPDCGAKMKGV